LHSPVGRATGPRTVLVTSVERPDREDGTIEMLAVDDVFDLLSRTHESGQRELQLVESQDAYANPRMQFEPHRVA